MAILLQNQVKFLIYALNDEWLVGVFFFLKEAFVKNLVIYSNIYYNKDKIMRDSLV